MSIKVQRGKLTLTNPVILGSGTFGIAVRYDQGKVIKFVFIEEEAKGEFESFELFSKSPQCSPHIVCAEEVILSSVEYIHQIDKNIDLPDGDGTGNVYGIVMEEMDGDISDLSLEKLGVKGVFDLLRQASAGLKYIHMKGYAHQDIKPENILYKKTGNSYIYKIADLGSICGKPPKGGCTGYSSFLYVAPEWVKSAMKKGSFDMYRDIIWAPKTTLSAQRADIWSMGLTLYEIVNPGGIFDLIDPKHILQSIASFTRKNMKMPENKDLKDTLRRLLSRVPKNRYTAKELYMIADKHAPEPDFNKSLQEYIEDENPKKIHSCLTNFEEEIGRLGEDVSVVIL